MRKGLLLRIGIFLNLLYIFCASAGFSGSLPEAWPLHKAIEMGDLDRVKTLLADTSVNAQDPWGITPLYKAVFHR